MKQDETICSKITEVIKHLNYAVRTGTLEVSEMGKLMHQIRQDATKMENALQHRRKIMERAGIEKFYQYEKKEQRSHPLTGINKLANRNEHRREKLDFEITIKENGTVIYQNMTHSVVLSIVESVEDIDEDGAIQGVTQRFFCGHDLVQWFAFNQLSTEFEGKKIQVLSALQNAVRKKVFSDPVRKKQLLDVIHETMGAIS